MSAALPHRSRARSWTGWLVLAGALVLAGVVLLQALQLSRLRDSLADVDEVRKSQMHSLETEFLQMRVEWMRALAGGTPSGDRALALRYDIWVGRTAMLRENTSMRRAALALDPAIDPTLARIERFVQNADAVFAGTPAPAERRAALAALVSQLDELADPIHELALAASHQASVDQLARNRRLAEHGRVSLALSGLLALAAMLALAVAVQQTWRLARRRAELAEATERTRQAELARDQSTRDLAQRLRAPLHGVLSTLSGLQASDPQARDNPPLRWASQATAHLLATLDGRSPDARPTLVRPLLEEVCGLMGARASHGGRSLGLVVDPGLPECVMADETLWRQALLEWLDAALQAGDGPLQLSATASRTPGGSDGLSLTLAGAGLGAVQLPPGATARLGGRMEAAHPDRLTLWLPATIAIDAGAEQAHDGPALQLLVAEDDADSRRAMAELIERLGHQAHFVPTGEEAVAAMRQGHFDLVLMDIHMPVLDGIEATRRIRALPRPDAATVPVVALTSDAFTDTREACLVAGMNSFLAKPVGIERLTGLLRQFFGSQGSYAVRLEAASPLIDEALVSRSLERWTPGEYADRLARFFADTEPRLRDLREAVREAQPARLHHLAEAVQASAGPLGLAALADTAGALCQGATNLPAHEVARLVQRFDDLLAASREAVQRSGLLDRLVRG